MKVKWKWSGGAWWLLIKAEFNPVAFAKEPAENRTTGAFWLRYDDLCKAFPGFQELVTPL